ncbi:unnamed protein product [Ostreobium quekettii]|uniref:Uncharacterized protein n=1 Tax=Ostreobium quekettii TaxID=121088 RepID=A0A8S1IXU2_9CHLO|nr:unnamed protein product [Ostreobium quekettii]|eukprot:evm.model.scf_828EXC.10 EVM.evm.TU.scf_828EXC.10   scf_828EXC:53195-54907(+)
MDSAAEAAASQRRRDELLVLAANHGFLADVEQLLGGGAQAAARDKAGICAIHFASRKGHAAVVQLLLSRGVDIDAEDPGGRTPLHYACAGGRGDVAKTLVKKGAWLDAYDARDDSALHLAVRGGHAPIVKQLLMGGAKTHLRNGRGLTPLGEAVAGGHLEAARLLVENGADAADRPRGYSLLHLAAGMGREGCLGLMLQHLKVGGVQCPGGVTPLHSAAVGGSAACVELLLESGVDPSAVDGEDKTALDWATEAGGEAAAAVLKKRAAKRKGKKKREAPEPAPEAQPMDWGDERIGEFAKLPHGQQMAQIEKWAEAPDQALRSLDHLDEGARKAIGEVGNFMRKLNCHRALHSLRQDEGFQEDVGSDAVMAAIQEVTRNPTAVQKYSSDKKIMGVLAKLRRLQAALRQNGRTKIIFDELVGGSSTDFDEVEHSLEESLKGAKEAVIEAVLQQKIKEDKQDKSLGRAAPENEWGRRKSRSTSNTLERESLWRAMGREFVRQFVLAVAVAALVLFGLWATNRLPWNDPKWLQEHLKGDGPRPATIIHDPQTHKNMYKDSVCRDNPHLCGTEL